MCHTLKIYWQRCPTFIFSQDFRISQMPVLDLPWHVVDSFFWQVNVRKSWTLWASTLHLLLIRDFLEWLYNKTKRKVLTLSVDANSQSSRHKHSLNSLRTICSLPLGLINTLNPKRSIPSWEQKDKKRKRSWSYLSRILPSLLNLPATIQSFLGCFDFLYDKGRFTDMRIVFSI